MKCVCKIVYIIPVVPHIKKLLLKNMVKYENEICSQNCLYHYSSCPWMKKRHIGTKYGICRN